MKDGKTSQLLAVSRDFLRALHNRLRRGSILKPIRKTFEKEVIGSLSLKDPGLSTIYRRIFV